MSRNKRKINELIAKVDAIRDDVSKINGIVSSIAESLDGCDDLPGGGYSYRELWDDHDEGFVDFSDWDLSKAREALKYVTNLK